MVSIMNVYDGDVGELGGYVSWGKAVREHFNLSLLFKLLARNTVEFCTYVGEPIFHKEPFSLDHSVVCLNEQVYAWKSGSEGLAGFET